MAIDITLTSVLYNPWSGSGGEALTGSNTLEVSYASLGFVPSTSDSYKSTAGDIFKVYIDGTRIYRESDSLYAAGKNFLEVNDVDNSLLNGVSSTWTAGTSDTVWTIETATQKIIINKTAIAAAALYATGATNAVTFSAGVSIIEVRREVQDQSSPAVDFSNASILTEQDLDNSSANVFHMAQQAIETAGNALVYDTGTSSYAAYQPGTSTRRKITQVADGVAANDVTNVGQFNTHDAAIEAQKVTTLAYREDTEDYKLEAADWATKVNGPVQVYTDNVAGTGGTSHSAKAHAIGGTGVDNVTGSAKDWAMEINSTPSSTAAEASAREWAIGTSTHKSDGSSKDWASQVGADVRAGSSGDKSAKSWAQETGGTAPALGSAKEWAQDTGGVVADSEWSAKNWATGTHASNAPTSGSAKEWAIGGQGTMATTPDGSEFSAKEYAQGSTATGGTAKEWAQTTGAAIDTTYSSKEYAQGSVLAAGGSAKNWAQLATTPTTGANDRSSKSWSQGASMTGATLGGSSKDWASTLVTQIDGTLYSSKENATGVTTALGSAKQWALGGGGSFTEGTAVAGSSYSSKKYATDSASSALAARNSAAAVANSFDSFDDTYLGRMADNAASATATTTGTWTDGSSTVTVANASGIAIGQLFISAGGVGVPTGANVISVSGTAIVLSDVFTGSDTTEACTFTGYGVYGTFNSGKDGPATDNDGGAVAAGMLYFNTTDNEMRICDGTNWIAASAAGTASLQEYKFVTTSGQVSNRTYSGTADVGGSFSYTQSNIIVFMNGVQLKDTTDYTATNGTSIVLAVAAVLNDEINIIAFKSFSVTNVEGTTVKSTGEGGGTKFLREDGDGTSSWQTVATVTGATQSAITTATNLTTVGALNSGSITSGFTSIDVGASGTINGTQIVSPATENIGVGTSALQAITTGDYNSAFGDKALTVAEDGIYNSAFGYNSLGSNVSGNNNCAFGGHSLAANTANYNSAFGYDACYRNTTGVNNSGFGYYALFNTTEGDNNTAIGYQSGDNITTGSNNIIIGAGIDADSATADNQLNIGGIIKGNLSTGNVGINTDTTAERLTIKEGSGSAAISFTDTDNAEYLVIGMADATNDLITGSSNINTVINNKRADATQSQIIFGTQNTERMRIDGSGNVGIGTTAPGSRTGTTANVLEVYNSYGTAFDAADPSDYGATITIHNNSDVANTASTLLFTHRSSGTGYAGISSLSDGADKANLLFFTRHNSPNTITERMRIDYDGNVGIGHAAPGKQLHIQDSSAHGTFQVGGGNGLVIDFSNSSNTTLNMDFGRDHDDGVWNFRTKTSGTPITAMTIKGNGNVSIVNDQMYLGGSHGWQANANNWMYLTDSSGTSYSSTYSNLGIYQLYVGSLITSSTLSVTSTKNFLINHPLPEKNGTHSLIHSSIEGPKVDLIYRDKVTLVDGSATINIDTVARMSEGTFVLLCDDVQCFTSNESDWDAVKGSVSGNILTIECENSSSTADVAWMVIGERKDDDILNSETTDENGKLIIEPLQVEQGGGIT